MMSAKENRMQDKCKYLLIEMANLMNALATYERINPTSPAVTLLKAELHSVEKKYAAREGI
jgi:hypothetical protein